MAAFWEVGREGGGGAHFVGLSQDVDLVCEFVRGVENLFW
jgi:hypothetical protein